MIYIVYIGMGVAMMCIIEGFLYALFPNQIRRIMAQILIMQTSQLKIMGISMVLIGVTLVYIVHLLFPHS